MVESSEQVFFYVHDLAGIFQYVSRSVENVHGWSPEELVGQHYSVLLDASALQQVDEVTRRALHSGERMAPYMVISRHKDGRSVPAEVIESPLIRDGEVVGMQGFVRDVSDRVNAQQRLMRAEERLRQVQKLDAVGRLAGGIAHDFNNILTAISGNSLLLLEESGLPEPVYEGLREIDDAAARAANLTRQLLAFSRNQVLRTQALELNAIISGMERMLRRVIGEQVEMRTVLAPNLPPILADAGQVEQLLMNLVVNSRDAMPQGGRIVIETRNAVHPDGATSPSERLAPGDPVVMMNVSDTGHGMDPATLERIFEPFFTTRPSGKGTGLGLAMVYGIVSQTGGAIQVESAPGEGTTFRIFFPPAEETGAEGAASSPEPAAEAVRTVLVVEDEHAVRRLIERVLRRAGYRVHVAEGPTEALEWAAEAERRVDLLLTDMVMPRMSGRALAERFVQMNALTRVMYVSGYSDEGGTEVPGGILQKPFSPEQLLARVQEVLGSDSGGIASSKGTSSRDRQDIRP
jgi:two-component system, cell cycle sensor histidine kinase and response regulator CckA